MWDDAKPGIRRRRGMVDRLAITDLWEAGETVEDIAYDYDMTPEQVHALCRAVVHLAA